MLILKTILFCCKFIRQTMILIVLLIISSCDDAAQPGDHPVVKIGEGSITGLREASGAKAFLGIPFAAAPVGALRFEEAVPKAIIEGNMLAQSYPPACPQNQGNVNWYKSVVRGVGGDPDVIAPLEYISEDCLYLNIWAPEGATKDLPVMVWIYGGSNVNGWSYEPNYQGYNLANKGVIVVTVQYRLGNLGFLPVPFEDKAANWGISDLVAALNWVNLNIGHFGGNPDNVTIFGESAGGGNVAALMLTPSAKGLFDKAIIQSGAVGPKATMDQAAAIEVATKTYQDAEITSIEDARTKSWQDIIALPAKSTYSHYHYPIADGTYTQAQPNWVSDVPLLIGSNKNENLMYVSGTPAEIIKRRLKDNERAADIQALLDQYSDDALTQVDYLSTLGGFQCPSLDIVLSVNSESYVYEFTRQRQGAEAIGAYHGAEIPYVFDTHDNWLPTDEPDSNLTATMMDYWVNFAKSGNPNSDNSPQWQAYSTANPYIQELGTSVRRSSHKPEVLCVLLNE